MSTPAKRIRSLSPSGSTSTCKCARLSLLSILSWNIENPSPYIALPKASGSLSSATSKSIPTYFQTSPSSSAKTKPKSETIQSTHRDKGDSTTLRNIFAAHGFPDICCLQEVRAMSSDKGAIRLLREAANTSATIDTHSLDSKLNEDNGPEYSAHFSLCQSGKGSKRFGVATYVSSDFKHAYTAREVTWDHEGRVLILTIPSLNLAIFNIYALNGSEYAWKDPKTGQHRGSRNERKREFNRLLMKETQFFQEDKGYKVIMIGDWNISRDTRDCYPRLRIEEPHAKARKEFNEIFIPTLGLLDIFREMHGSKRSYSWFSPHKPDRTDAARVDFALISHELKDFVQSIEYLEEKKWRYRSDHAPLKLVMNITGCLQGKLKEKTLDAD